MRILCTLFVIAGLALLFGCDGEPRHDIATGEDGSLLGMYITPEPQSLYVDTGDEFFLEWDRGYLPPREFTFTVEQVDSDGATHRLNTEYTKLGTGKYKFDPNGLPSGTFLLLTVSANHEVVKAMYLTDDALYAPAMSRTAPADTNMKNTQVITR